MEALIRTEGLSLAFGGIVAADGIDFRLDPNERLAVIGANGAGKTTFINICTGYLKPNRGKVFFQGRDITALTPREIARLGVGRSFQLPQLFTEHTVRQCLQLSAIANLPRRAWLRPLADASDSRDIDAVLELVGLREHADACSASLPEGLRKLLDVAMALILRPQLIIMDEPTSGVASEEKHALMQTLMDALQERGVTSWFVEHDTEIVMRYATRVAAWIDGRIAADGDPRQVFDDPVVRREVLGTK